jgi:hypothetical protein
VWFALGLGLYAGHAGSVVRDRRSLVGCGKAFNGGMMDESLQILVT